MSDTQTDLVDKVMALEVCRVKDLCSEKPAECWGIDEPAAIELIKLIRESVLSEVIDEINASKHCDFCGGDDLISQSEIRQKMIDKPNNSDK